ncbi:MAG TPA: hypothetical protein VNG53_07685 [Bacteroidia bacterium]|nr:hypothetical protein [Bacteroidia bacterium]
MFVINCNKFKWKKVRYLLFVYLQLISIYTYAQRRKNTEIIWSKDSILKWNDFRNIKHDLAGDAASQTFTNIFCTPSNCLNDTVQITCYCALNKELSWGIKMYETPQLLNHEQKHFDITEIHTRLLRKAMANKKFKYWCFYRQFRRLYNKALKAESQEQSLYDKETDHGLRSLNQKKWDAKIANELKALDAYSDIHVTVRLRHFLFF